MAEEEWDFADGLKSTRSFCVCMTCQYFSYVRDQHCHTLLTFGLHRRQVPHGEHLTKRCRNWMVRREAEMGWCPEVAATGVAGGAFLRWSGWFDSGLIHSSAESMY